MLGSSTTAAYVLRALACLARGDGGLRSSRSIAAATGIPRPYLVKLLRVLAERGFVKARRGYGGGFRLARRPEEISLSEILAAAGDAPSFERCLLGLGRCSASLGCPVHPTWSRLRPRLERSFDELTLRDLGGSARLKETP